MITDETATDPGPGEPVEPAARSAAETLARALGTSSPPTPPTPVEPGPVDRR